MCARGEAIPIKVNNPATIHGANWLIVKENNCLIVLPDRRSQANWSIQKATPGGSSRCEAGKL